MSLKHCLPMRDVGQDSGLMLAPNNPKNPDIQKRGTKTTNKKKRLVIDIRKPAKESDTGNEYTYQLPYRGCNSRQILAVLTSKCFDEEAPPSIHRIK